MEFYANHGLYDLEQKAGNWFWVDIEVTIVTPTDIHNIQLSDSIDYSIVYRIVSDIMNTPTKLLETLCGKICTQVKQKFSHIIKIKATVSKLNPPLKGKVRRSYVTLEI